MKECIGNCKFQVAVQQWRETKARTQAALSHHIYSKDDQGAFGLDTLLRVSHVSGISQGYRQLKVPLRPDQLHPIWRWEQTARSPPSVVYLQNSWQEKAVVGTRGGRLWRLSLRLPFTLASLNDHPSSQFLKSTFKNFICAPESVVYMCIQ